MTRLAPEPTPCMTAASALCAAVEAEHRLIPAHVPARQKARARTAEAVEAVRKSLAVRGTAAHTIAGPLRDLIKALQSETLMIPVSTSRGDKTASIRAVTVEARRAAARALAAETALTVRTQTLRDAAMTAVRVGAEGVPRSEVRGMALDLLGLYGSKHRASAVTRINAHSLERAAQEADGWCTGDVARRIRAAHVHAFPGKHKVEVSA